ncbi:hypothetical protein FACS18948_5250 [Clostridia bacterium]|nr:hypothetical protein FACS18948_5250 [Clostridia bacterium]
MITLNMVKPIGGLLKRLDIKTIVERLKVLDASKLSGDLPDADTDAGKSAREERESETARLGEILLVGIAERLEDAADDLIKLCAAYKGVTFEEAAKLDALATLSEIVRESGFIPFFKSAVSSVLKM